MAWKRKNEDVKCSDSRMIQNPAEGWTLAASGGARVKLHKIGDQYH
jgi:hypothetical protein